MSQYPNRKYITFNVSELDNINFTQVEQTSSDTVRKSIDGTLSFVKYDGNEPSSITSLTTKSQVYTYEEMMSILSTSAWVGTAPNTPS
jgi:hypothetical protein